MDGDNFVRFKSNVGRRFAKVHACLKEHEDRLEVAEDRLDVHEQNLADLKTATEALQTTTEALKRIDMRAAEARARQKKRGR